MEETTTKTPEPKRPTKKEAVKKNVVLKKLDADTAKLLTPKTGTVGLSASCNMLLL